MAVGVERNSDTTVAALLRIYRGAAYEAARAGALPGVLHFGRTIRISRYAIEQLLQRPEAYPPSYNIDPGKTSAPAQTAKGSQG